VVSRKILVISFGKGNGNSQSGCLLTGLYSIYSKMKTYENHPKRQVERRSIQYFDKREQKVPDLKSVFHNERMNVWNQSLKSRKYRDTLSPDNQEKMHPITVK